MLPAVATHLKQQFGINSEAFTVIMIGKDGTKKQRARAPVEPIVTFRAIDAMPMCQQEQRFQP